MDFDINIPIYLQIAEAITSDILKGRYAPGDRIPSVRETAAETGVNPNTVARSYEMLDGSGIISNRRGIGYFVNEKAPEKILESERNRFIDEELPKFRQRAAMLGIDLKKLFL